MSGSTKLKTIASDVDSRNPITNKIRARSDLDIEVTRYRTSRFFAIYLNGELLAVTVYKKGALAIRAALLRR